MGSLKQEDELEAIGEESKEAILYVNGVRRVLPDGLAHITLLEYLRGKKQIQFTWCLAGEKPQEKKRKLNLLNRQPVQTINCSYLYNL